MWSEVDVFGHVRTSVGWFVGYTIALSIINCTQIYFDAQVDKYQRCALGKRNTVLSLTLSGSYFMYDLIDAIVTYAIANSNLISIAIMLIVEAGFVYVLYRYVLAGDPPKHGGRVRRAFYGRSESVMQCVRDMDDHQLEELRQIIMNARPCRGGNVTFNSKASIQTSM